MKTKQRGTMGGAANENVSPTWDGVAPQKGWHWLKRKRKAGGLRIAFSLTGANWRIADGIGRTTVLPSATVRKLFDYVAPVALPDEEDRANQ